VNKEFMTAINQVSHDRQLPKEVVLEAVEAALVSAYRRRSGSTQGITARIDLETGAARIFTDFLVVEQVADDKREIALESARLENPDVGVGDTLAVETTPDDFGRIAAQTARQVILQRIREAERDSLYHAYSDREGEIINGTVQSIDSQQVTLSLGKVEAVLPRSEQMPTERYSIGQRLRAYVSEVQKTPRGPLIIVSRTHRNMLRRLLELEVPEIFNGTVEIKAIAREAGYRSKVAVVALQEGVDPVGSCVGMRGVRIQSIVNELNGEKIDVVAWSPDAATLIANGLSPAKVLNVILEEDGGDKTAIVVVPDRQLSLAIGKEGQNARLAAKLTSWRIDIKSITEAASEALSKASEQSDLQAAVVRDQDMLTIARDILAEKEGAALSEGELQALSQTVRIVRDAELSLVKERAAVRLREAIARALETPEPSPSRARAEVPGDILARAEAILSGASVEDVALQAETGAVEQEPGQVALTPEMQVAPVIVPEREAEIAAQPAESAELVEAGQAPVSVDTEPVAAVTADAAQEIRVETPGTVVAPAVQPELEVWDEEAEDGSRTRPKKKARSKRTDLVYDESVGGLVSQRQRKPGRQRDNWEDLL
jgi:N utilization substance protein A